MGVGGQGYAPATLPLGGMGARKNFRYCKIYFLTKIVVLFLSRVKVKRLLSLHIFNYTIY